ncbi:MAG: DUF1501 domain-containing protein [Sulfurovaceae bacterium]|nr:DUF1501 domain-containing protein [Sulfurovaceae bacterium]
MKRRDFLRFTGSYAALAGLTSMGIPLNLFGDDTSTLTGYKALVVLLQHGGNDSLNMLVPSGDDAKKGYANYASIRTTLAVQNSDLSADLTVTDKKLVLSSNPYALNSKISEAYTKGFYKHSHISDLATNGVMPEFAHLVNQGKVAMVANTGNIIQPTSKEKVKKKVAILPPYLYAHNNQRKLLFTGEASNLQRAGWAGLLSDEWSSLNGESVYGINISLRGVTHLLYGENSEPLIIKPSGPIEYKGINRTVHDNWLDISQDEKFTELYNKLRKKSFIVQDTLVNDWNNKAPTFSSVNAYGGELFSLPSNDTLGIGINDKMSDKLITQFEAVAKLAKIGKESGLKRQIFYVSQGGYDTHANQAQNHPKLLRELSLALGDFQLALDEMGMEDDVTTFNISDFGRSVGNNGDGTDHAWGANHFVLGGAVTGGRYGTLPDLTLGGEDDASNKGRLIPTTSMSQYLGTVVKWFGADEVMLNTLFPERINFTQRDLGFMG